MKRVSYVLSTAGIFLFLGLSVFSGCQSRSVIQQIYAHRENQVQYSVQESELENGLKVIWIEDTSLPWISLNLLMRQGAVHDGGTGLNFLTAQLLDQGAGSLNARQFARAIEQTGSRFLIQAGYDFTLVSVEGLNHHRERFLSLFWDVITAPRFEAADFERKRKEILAQITRMRDNPGQRIDELFGRQVFGEHPYGSLVMGSEYSLGKISRQDVVRHYQNSFVPNKAVLLVAGRFDTSFKEQVKERFTKWASSSRAMASPEKPLKFVASAPRKVLYTLKGVRQAQIRFGGPSLARAHEDVIAIRLADSILGGGSISTSRLMSRLRFDQGLTYGAYAFLDARQQAGIFSIGTSTEVKNTSHVLNEIQAIFTEFNHRGVTQREFVASQAQALGQFPKAIETSSRFSRQYLSLIGLGLEGEEIIRFPGKVAALDRLKVNSAIRRHLATLPVHIAVLGPPELAQEPGFAGFEVVALN